MEGFGLAYLKKEGAPIHPDDPIMGDLTDEEYIKQASGYLDATGWDQLGKVWWSRPELIPAFKKGE